MDQVERFPWRCRTVLAALLFNALCSTTSPAADASRMTAAELKAALGGADLVVVDVRVDASVAETKIPGAAIENSRDVAAWATKYPKGKTIVLYCS